MATIYMAGDYVHVAHISVADRCSAGNGELAFDSRERMPYYGTPRPGFLVRSYHGPAAYASPNVDVEIRTLGDSRWTPYGGSRQAIDVQGADSLGAWGSLHAEVRQSDVLPGQQGNRATVNGEWQCRWVDFSQLYTGY